MASPRVFAAAPSADASEASSSVPDPEAGDDQAPASQAEPSDSTPEPGEMTEQASEPAAVPEPSAEVSAVSPDPQVAPSTSMPPAPPSEVVEPREPTDFGVVPLSTITASRSRDADLALRRDKARGWRNAGIAGLAVGSALILGGALMLSSDPAKPELGNSNFSDARNRAGYTIMAPGLLVAAGGVAMLTAGIVQERRLQLSPTASREGAGVSVRARF